MYGVESNSTGLGGLASQAPGGDAYFGNAMQIRPQVPAIFGGASATDPRGFAGQIAQQVPASLIGTGNVSADGRAVELPVSHQQRHWSSVLDFHNSVAPWILLAILLFYGWVHASVRVGHRFTARF